MAYARFGPDSDVHVIPTGSARMQRGGEVIFRKTRIECINCRLGPKDFVTAHPDAMLEHLRQHIAAGDKVPSEAIDRLLDEWFAAEYTSRDKSVVVLFRGGYDDPSEVTKIKPHFDVVTSRGAVPKSSLVVGRYSVLPFYRELCEDLALQGSALINSYTQHRYLADMGNWYRDLQGITPETWTQLEAVPQDAWPCVLKGETNSKKWQWNTHMFAESPEAARQVEDRLREDGLLCDQTIYYRRYVPLDNVADPTLTNGPPITREFRFFICDGYVLCGGFYWAGCIPEDAKTPDYRDVPMDLLRQVMDRVGANARFYVVDVAKTESGDWIVVELNDGQMSGLSDNDPDVLYANLRFVLDGGKLP